MLIIKKLTKQCTPCPSASVMILQKGIVISLEGRHLVLTLLTSIFYIMFHLDSDSSNIELCPQILYKSIIINKNFISKNLKLFHID